jgi:hypothetical protein
MLVNVERFETKRTGHQVKSKKTENQLSLDR